MSDEEPWPVGGAVTYTPKWAKSEGPATRLWAQEHGLIVRATERGVFVDYGSGSPKLTDPADLHLIVRPGQYEWTPDEEAPDGDEAAG